MTKLTTTLVCAFAVLAFSAGAWAQNDEAVDWDEAIEFAELTDTYVENGVEWVTYYDELQGAMWSQPADATPEAVKAYFTGDKETLKDMGLDTMCIWQWLVPYYVYILDDLGSRVMYSDDIFYDRPGGSGANYHKIWRAYGGYSAFLDVDTSIRSQAKNTAIDYTDDYNGRWSSPTSGYQNDCTDETADDMGDYYRYIVYKTGDAVNNWNYSVGNCYPLAKHEFYACDYWRYLEVEFCTQYIE